MWIASKFGWFSIVQKTPGVWHVRARVKRDLDNLKKAAEIPGEIERWPDADYRFRIIVEDPAVVVRIFMEFASSIDYSNFKSMILTRPDQRAKIAAYHEIWGEMHAHQRFEEKSHAR